MPDIVIVSVLNIFLKGERKRKRTIAKHHYDAWSWSFQTEFHDFRKVSFAHY